MKVYTHLNFPSPFLIFTVRLEIWWEQAEVWIRVIMRQPSFLKLLLLVVWHISLSSTEYSVTALQIIVIEIIEVYKAGGVGGETGLGKEFIWLHEPYELFNLIAKKILESLFICSLLLQCVTWIDAWSCRWQSKSHVLQSEANCIFLHNYWINSKFCILLPIIRHRLQICIDDIYSTPQYAQVLKHEIVVLLQST